MPADRRASTTAFGKKPSPRCTRVPPVAGPTLGQPDQIEFHRSRRLAAPRRAQAEAAAQPSGRRQRGRSPRRHSEPVARLVSRAGRLPSGLEPAPSVAYILAT